MKKIVLILLVCFMMLIFAGCGMQGGMAGEKVHAAENVLTDEPEIHSSEEDRTDTAAPDPAEEKQISEEAAYRIACEHWGFREGDTDPDTGYRMTVFREGMMQQGESQFFAFRLSWLVNDHWSALDTVYVNALTGEKTEDPFQQAV